MYTKFDDLLNDLGWRVLPSEANYVCAAPPRL